MAIYIKASETFIGSMDAMSVSCVHIYYFVGFIKIVSQTHKTFHYIINPFLPGNP